VGGSTTSYDWNADNRLVRASGPMGVAEFGYDADGNRVTRQVAGDLTRFLVDANNPTGLSQVLEERGSSGELRAQYTYGAGLLAGTANGATAFHHGDGLGSTRLLTDAAGAVTDQYQYDAFGGLIAASGSTSNSHLFAGEQFEPALGLYNLRARNYDASVGRFLGRDPFEGRLTDPRSLSPYLYAHADPVNNTDPMGLFSLLEISSALAIEDVLRGIEVARNVVQYCAITGKAEMLQEALFWGQFAAAGPIIASEVFGTRQANASVEATFFAKRYVNVFKSPDKIVEGKAAVSFARNGDRKLGVEFKREDGATVGADIDLNNPANSSVRAGTGAFSFAVSGSDVTLGAKKTLDIFKVERCAIEMVKGSLEVGASVSIVRRPSVTADIVLEGLAGMVKFTYPLIPELVSRALGLEP
jgi:RHS repeat-associated protein